MSECHLTVIIDPVALTKLQGFILCLGKGYQAASGDVTFELVATAEIMTNNIFSWVAPWVTGSVDTQFDSAAAASQEGHFSNMATAKDGGSATTSNAPDSLPSQTTASGTSQPVPVPKMAVWFSQSPSTAKTKEYMPHLMDFTWRQSATTTFTNACTWEDAP